MVASQGARFQNSGFRGLAASQGIRFQTSGFRGLANVYNFYYFLFFMREFKTLEVWKRSIKIVKKVYEIVDTFPKKEDYALGSQLRRAVVSISSNIAEGCGRRTNKDTVQFLYIALGSVNEVESQLFIAREFGYLLDDVLGVLINELREIAKMLMGLIDYVSR